MPTLIKQGEVVPNPWQTVGKEENIEEALARDSDRLLVPFKMWLEEGDRLKASGKRIGLWLDSDEEPESIPGEVNDFPLIALNFPVFSDGRGFSSAVVLRQHLGYTGELRAIGDVQRDPLFYMKRCGFDSFELAENVKTEDALRAFDDFHNNYQSTVEAPEPLFRRR